MLQLHQDQGLCLRLFATATPRNLSFICWSYSYIKGCLLDCFLQLQIRTISVSGMNATATPRPRTVFEIVCYSYTKEPVLYLLKLQLHHVQRLSFRLLSTATDKSYICFWNECYSYTKTKDCVWDCLLQLHQGTCLYLLKLQLLQDQRLSFTLFVTATYGNIICFWSECYSYTKTKDCVWNCLLQLHQGTCLYLLKLELHQDQRLSFTLFITATYGNYICFW